MLYSLLLADPWIFGLSGTSGSLTGTAATLGFTFYLFNYLLSAMGPATIIGGTIIVPELVPTKARASGQAINVFIDRVAAALAITSFPLLLERFGLSAMLSLYAGIAIISSVIMFYILPETKGRPLEEISGELKDAMASPFPQGSTETK